MVNDRGNMFVFSGGLIEIIFASFISRGNFSFNLGRANSSLAFGTHEAVL